MKKRQGKFFVFSLGLVLCLSFLGVGASMIKTNYFGGISESALDVAGSSSAKNEEGVGSGAVSGETVIVRDVVSEEDLRLAEANTIIESVVLEEGDSESFFADAVISEQEKVWVANGMDNMPQYSASAEEGKWEAKLTLGSSNSGYKVKITGVVFRAAGTIVLPDKLLGYNVVGIGALSFTNEELVTGVTISQYIERISNGAFAGCTSLEAFAVKSGNTHFCAVDGVLYDYAVTRLVAYPLGNPATTYTLPDTLRQISAGVFKGSKLEEVVFADGEKGLYVDESMSESYTGSILDAEGDIFIKEDSLDGQEYTISYYDGGEADGIAFTGDATDFPTVHTFGTDTELPLGFFKQDESSEFGVKLFVAWYDNYLCEGEAIEVLDAEGYTENIKLYAKWDNGIETNEDEENPIVYIDSLLDWYQIASIISSGNEATAAATFIQTANIECSAILEYLGSGVPVTFGTLSHPFTGTYDGQGYEFRNFVLETSETCAGLFGAVQEATIKNVTVDNISISTSATKTFVGGVVGGAANSVIDNCKVSGNIESMAEEQYSGGIVGAALVSQVTNCVNSGNVSGSYSGGIVGYGAPVEVVGCVNYGTVSGIVAGGIVGGAANVETLMESNTTGSILITECHNLGNVFGPEGKSVEDNIFVAIMFGVGGIVGTVAITAPQAEGTYSYEISHCSNYGECQNTWWAMGGIIGSCVMVDASTPVMVSYCHNNANLSATESVVAGGIVGAMGLFGLNCAITNCYSVGQLTAEQTAGIVYAVGGETSTFSNCYWLEGTATSSGLEEISSGEGIVITNFSAQTDTALRSGILEGLNDEKWLNLEGCYPTLKSEQLTENGIVYLSPSKEVVVDITTDFDPSVSKISYTTKVILAGALEGATDISFDSSVGQFVGAYTDEELQNEYTGDLTSATQDLYLKWQLPTYEIIYKDANGEEFSGTMPEGYPESHTFGVQTTLPIPTKDGGLFAGWYFDAGCSSQPVGILGSKGHTSTITLYAKWFDGLSIDVESGKIAVDSAESLILVSELINSDQSLWGIGAFANADYIQTADIDFNSVENALTPIGTSSTPFEGSYDGNGYEIKNLIINLPETNYVALFARVGTATITDVVIKSGSIVGKGYVAGIVAYVDNENVHLTGCENYASVMGSSDYVGGIVARLYNTYEGTNATLENCVNYGDITGPSYVGGVVGRYEHGWGDEGFNHCTNYGAVTGSESYVGGVAGYVTYQNAGNEVINNNTNNGNITGYAYVGGIVGYFFGNGGSSADSTGNVNTGNITGSGANVGGIFGYLSQLDYIEYCANTGSITGTNYVGGIVGYNDGDSYEYCRNEGALLATGTGEVFIGGIVSYYSSKISNCYSVGAISAPKATTPKVGAILSVISASGTATNCYWLEGTATVACAEGNGTVTNCVAVTADQLKGGTLAGLTDTSIWFYDGTNYPTLVADQYEEDGVIYSSVEKGAIIDITESFDASTFVVPLSVKLIKANAFAGATSVVFNQVGGSATLYEDLNFETAYSGEIQNATQDIYVKWGYNALDIIYKDAGGGDFSGSNLAELVSTHTPGTETVLVDASGENGKIFAGWSLEENGGILDCITSIGAYEVDSGPVTVYAVWVNGIVYDSESQILEVWNAEGLKNVSTLVNNGITLQGIDFATASYKQLAHLDFKSVENAIKPIGRSFREFMGIYDGNGYEIRNLIINLPETNVAGLFGNVKGATINNVTIASGNISANLYVAGVVAHAKGVSNISNCVNYATISGSGAIGGVVGEASAETKISLCVNHGDVVGRFSVGGIVGQTAGTNDIIECVNHGSVEGSSNNVGGIVGYWYYPTSTVTMYLEYCANYGDVTGSYNVGGIVGDSYSSAGSSYATTKHIRYCHNQGNVSATTTSTAYVGGIVGYVSSNYDSSSQNKDYHYIESCYSTGAVSAPNASNAYIGGVVGCVKHELSSGSSDQITLTNCYWLTGTTGGAYGGYNYLEPTVTNCSAQSEASLKGGTLAGLTDTSIWYYDGGTSYPKLQFEVGNTMPELSATNEREGEESQNLVAVSKASGGEEKKTLVSSLKVFGLATSGIFVLFTILASRKKREE